MKASSILAALALLLVSAKAAAYPTSIVFAPTGDAREFLGFNGYVYTSATFRSKDPGTNDVGPRLSSTWTGIGFGVLPSFEYGHGVRFGGFELGVSFLSPDLRGQDHILTLFDAKAGLLVEGQYYPSVAVGFIGLSPQSDQLVNFGYVSLSKTLRAREDATSYGRLTLGVGHAFVPSSQLYPACETSGDPCDLRGSPPFADKNVAPILGYESPAFGVFSFGLDSVGGTSPLSSTNVILNLQVADGAYFSLGMFFANDRRTAVTGGYPQDGVFVSVAMNANLKKLFGPKPE